MVLWVGPLVGGEEPAQRKDPPADETGSRQAQLAAEFLKLAVAEAASYEFAPPCDAARPFTLRWEPALRWSNPVIGEIYGGVFLWTESDQPAVVGSLFKGYSPYTHMTHELQSLTATPLVGRRGGEAVWTCEGPGVSFQPATGAPQPTVTATSRLVQMRRIAEQFDLTERDKNGVERELRLLRQPIYRYRSASAGVADGAVFAFVVGTDPEALFVIEAAGDRLQWRFAFARLNVVGMRARQAGATVWEVAPLESRAVDGHDGPYTKFHFGEIRRTRRVTRCERASLRFVEG